MNLTPRPFKPLETASQLEELANDSPYEIVLREAAALIRTMNNTNELQSLQLKAWKNGTYTRRTDDTN